MLYYELLGFLAGAMTTLGYIPQIVRLFKLKSAYEVSLPFTIIFLAGGLCWLIYGVLLSLLPIILWNSVSLVLLTLLIYTKLKFGSRFKAYPTVEIESFFEGILHDCMNFLKKRLGVPLKDIN